MNPDGKRRLLRPADLAIAAVLLLLAGALFLIPRAGGGKTAVVVVGGETVSRIDLDAVAAPYELDLGCGVTLAVSPGEIRFAASDCRGQDCVRCGALKSAGQTAACLPNRVLVYVDGKPAADAPDAIVY